MEQILLFGCMGGAPAQGESQSEETGAPEGFDSLLGALVAPVDPDVDADDAQVDADLGDLGVPAGSAPDDADTADGKLATVPGVLPFPAELIPAGTAVEDHAILEGTIAAEPDAPPASAGARLLASALAREGGLLPPPLTDDGPSAAGEQAEGTVQLQAAPPSEVEAPVPLEGRSTGDEGAATPTRPDGPAQRPVPPDAEEGLSPDALRASDGQATPSTFADGGRPSIGDAPAPAAGTDVDTLTGTADIVRVAPGQVGDAQDTAESATPARPPLHPGRAAAAIRQAPPALQGAVVRVRADRGERAGTSRVHHEAPVAVGGTASSDQAAAGGRTAGLARTLRAALPPDVTHSVVRQAVRAVRIAGTGGGAVRLHLHPPELGEMHVRVSVEGGTVTADLRVESHAVREAILSGLGDLQRALADHRLTVGHVDVTVADNGDDTPWAGEGGRREPVDHQADGDRHRDGDPDESPEQPAGRTFSGGGFHYMA